MTTINLIGAGRVGRALGRAWHSSGAFCVQDVLTRSLASAEQAVAFIGAGRAVTEMAQMRPADVWMLAVPDSEIASTAAALAKALAKSPHLAKRATLTFHCSGALASAEMEPLRALGWQLASAHCLLSFANPELALQQLAGTPCALEGDPLAVTALQPAFESLGARCFGLAAEHKLLYHAGAVFATNFLPVLQDLAQQLWQGSGMSAAMAAQLNATLLHNAVDNLLALGPASALTGPAARGDTALVQRQGDAVAQWDATAGEAYRALSQLASKLAAK
ncbi:MAG: DUF2520 domain-containing protein [Gammaproteobacteria bacterium]|uniref:Rossmann-like and DUF2520 domain-containing protein n=1 Tax=Rhodoferax sp. TaxID=50421 RepID=UPI0018231EE7|nr:Rossmann-like and DUF2520 domain-containing protein [Rhodoferax sp.]MBU3899494.1 DUF2520 domain-containing protein [Gammaproteobacteria bacterium]MBA3059564.1 DUF2520 domain-containing protein [Rhodoferax sp.]MBU3998693.1 DUF2520 domain-containing protein [Gammaproteobacteria bacterium]MBU4017970.1 DUF2520 domain-containing protein [Gammaproteobacteria bacterium]MBU4080340.1 DUF2520 domain-containing protein [Gammaproteobacteria bacterium]